MIFTVAHVGEEWPRHERRDVRHGDERLMAGRRRAFGSANLGRCCTTVRAAWPLRIFLIVAVSGRGRRHRGRDGARAAPRERALRRPARAARDDARASRAGPAWSPSEDLTAYVAAGESGHGPINVARPDSAGVRTLTAGTDYGGLLWRLDWSPDGKYLVASSRGRITVVDVATGEEMPIRITAVDDGLESPSWKP